MKVELTDGCTAYELDIDGFPFHKIHDNALEQITNALLKFIKRECLHDRTYLQDLIISTTERFGDPEYQGICEQCGDSIYKTRLDMSLKRNPYRMGIKHYLSTFVVGETRTLDKPFPWGSVKSTASAMKREFGCKFKLSFKKQTITRLA